MALPYGTTGSLCSSFLPVRPVCLPVKLPYAITLCGRLPIGLREPLEASVTLLEATTPVKLPTKHRPPNPGVRSQPAEGPYFNNDYPPTGIDVSKPPDYPTHPMADFYAKLQ